MKHVNFCCNGDLHSVLRQCTQIMGLEAQAAVSTSPFFCIKYLAWERGGTDSGPQHTHHRVSSSTIFIVLQINDFNDSCRSIYRNGILVVVSIVMVDSQPYGNGLGVLVGLPNKELSPTVRRNLLSNIPTPANKLPSQNIIPTPAIH